MKSKHNNSGIFKVEHTTIILSDLQTILDVRHT